MALFQIRKGSTASKGTLAAGELYDNTELQTLQLGIDGNTEVTLMTSASIVNTISASLEASILALSASISTSLSASTANLTFDSSSLEASILSLSSSVATTDSTQTNNIATISASAWGAFQSASAYSSSLKTSITTVSQSVYDLSASLASNSTLSSSIYLTDATQSSHITALENYSSSLKTAIELTGSSVTVQGDLFVRGTTTTINSTTVNLSASFIEVDAGGAVDGGIYVIDRVGGGSVTGSLVWDVSANIWKAGAKGIEVELAHILDVTDLSSSIRQTDLTQSNNITTISASAWGAFQSASAYSSSFYTTINNLSGAIYQTDATQSTNISNLSSSLYTLSGSVTTISSSISTSLSLVSASLNTFSSSYKTDSSSFDNRISASVHRIDSLALGAGAQLGDDNTFTGQNTFTQALTASIVWATDNGAGQNFKVGDDGWIGDINISNTIGVKGQQDSSKGFIKFGNTNDAPIIGNTGNDNLSISGNVSASGDISASNLYITNAIYAYELHTIIESSSVIYSSGSNQIGDTQNDVLTITGSLYQTGSTTFSELTGSLFAFSSSLNSRIGNTNVETLSASIYLTEATQSTNISNLSSSVTTISSSISTSLSLVSASLTILSSSYSTDSASFDTRIINNSASIALLSSSYLDNSGSQYKLDATQSFQISAAFATASVYSASLAASITASTANVTALSQSLYFTDTTQSVNITEVSSSLYTLKGNVNTISSSISTSLSLVSASLQSSSLYYSSSVSTSLSSVSSSIYTRDANQDTLITTNSASAWGAFQSASAYSASAVAIFATTGSNTFIGTQTITGSLLVTGDVTAYASSDERLKDNIQLIANPIEKVQQLRGVEFDWNDKVSTKAGEHDYGVIAQDVLNVMPQLVKQRYDGYYGVDYDKIVGLLIEVVKEQEKRIKELENKMS